MKRAIDIGAVDAAAIRTRGGKVRLRLLLSVEQLESMLRAAIEEEGDDEEAIDDKLDDVKRSVTQCNAPESEKRREDSEDGGDARARSSPKSVFVIEGTKAWEAWIEHRQRTGQRASLPTTLGHGEHAGKRGWYFQTLFPPRET